MDFYNCKPSVKSCNVIMNILIEIGYFNKAHKVYLWMRDKGIASDVYTFTIRIKTFCQTGRPHAALRLLRNMTSQGCDRNAAVYCTVIGGLYEWNYRCEGLCRKSTLVEAVKLSESVTAEGLTPQVVMYNTLIGGLCKNSRAVEAESFLSKMVNCGLQPDDYRYNTIINGY
ncbi:hypothetical protein NL676_028980 [Syzygium grande]|nr:hypothetical protein NL676_028980 [Syzygium grande]